MLQLRVTVNNQIKYVDLFGDEQITLDYSFAEIQGITTKNSSFTRSFSVPGSKNNNDIFQHYYNPNVVVNNYDVRAIIPAVLIEDGYELMEGNIRLENVVQTKTEVIYSITFYSNVGTLISNLGNKVLAELDFSSLDHGYSLSAVTSTLYDGDFTTTGMTPYTYMLAQYGYDYDNNKDIISGSTPIIDFRGGSTLGYFDNPGTPLRYYYLKPAIQVKWLYNQIFNEAGFKLNSDFFDTAYFDRYYLPLTFTTDSLYLNQAIKPQYDFLNSSQPSGTPISYSAFSWTNLAVGPAFPLNLNRIEQISVGNNNINAQAFGNKSFVVPEDGVYRLSITWGGFAEYTGSTATTLTAFAKLFLNQIEQGGPNGTTGTTNFDAAQITFSGAGGWFENYTFYTFLSTSWFYSIDVFMATTAGRILTNYIKFEILDGPRLVVGDVDLGEEFPPTEVRQIDFISSVNKRLNLMVVPDPDEPKALRVEPVIDYMGKGDTLDWTYKLDRNNPIKYEPTTNYVNGTFYFTGQKDEDFGNTEFTKITNNTYGTQYINFLTDFKNEQTKFEDMFSNPVDDILNNLGAPNVTIPIYYITREENNEGTPEYFYNSRKTVPRMVFKGVNLPAKTVGFYIDGSGITYQNSFYIDTQEIDVFPLYNRFTTYPFGLTGLTHAVNYNKRQRFNQVEYDFSCYEDLYDVYWEDYSLDLVSEENRVLTGKFYLHPEDIANLKGNERILVDNNYYRINKIKGLNLNAKSLVNVELIKITESYEPHRIRYFTLENCDDPNDKIYTNTDLNYTIYAYVNKRVSVDGSCYTILKDDFVSGRTYEKIIVPFRNNSFQPLFYDDCGCSAFSDDVFIYREIDCVTGQPQGPITGGTEYYYYIIENCFTAQQQLARSYTYYPTGTSVRIGGFDVCYFVVAVVNIPNTNDITNSYVDCETCQADLPSPTPTATLTPTPTITPTSNLCDCREYLVESDLPFPEQFSYVDCNTQSVDFYWLGAYQTVLICSCNGGITIPQGFSYSDQDACDPNPTPTTTPTPTRTPTPTNVCDCRQYYVSNGNEFTVFITYVDCETRQQVQFTLLSSQNATFCSCSYPTQSGGFVFILDQGPCAVTPTPTPLPITPTVTPSVTITRTPTNTPTKTPTPTGTLPPLAPTSTPTATNSPVPVTPTPTVTKSPDAYAYKYKVADCDDPASVIECVGSNTLFSVGEVVKLQLTPGCWTIQDSCSGSVLDIITLNYGSNCDDCPR